MTDLYKPREGLRIPMPGRQPDWPAEGRPVNFASPYEARLVKAGDLVKVEDQPEATGSSGRKK
ncbi:hypothetical protein HGP14_02905 [Rhizobium sp. P32RR-XVIII]|uniref:hypothetical protein n=1 Tax=Rhizobium sp. P32RR-XVIII TaxID=2726738 RepID=UPI001457310B|nr:hypothetical protein [Rhizobium sp. P32RR-XVIII]NLS02319.1 hypothetical protein [Rhizobium sp. P32RR-XVIII]